MNDELLDLYLNQYPVGPLYIKRLSYIVQKFTNLTTTNIQIIERLLDIILQPDSYYRYYNQTSKLIDCLSKYERDVTSYVEKFESISKSLPNSHISESLSIMYDMELDKLFSREVGQEGFNAVVKLLERKALDFLMCTGVSDHVNDNSSYLYNANPDYLIYHKRAALREVESLIIYKNYDNSLHTLHDFLLRKLQQILEYDKDESDDNDDDKMMLMYDNVPKLSSEQKLSEEETIAYWNCRWYLLYTLFLNDNYISLVDEFESLITEPAINGMDANNVLENHYHSDLIVLKYLMRTICFSILIVKKTSELARYWQLPVLKKAISSDLLLKNLIKFYTNCQFLKFNETVKSLEDEFQFDYQLSINFQLFKNLMRFKSYIIYLSVVKSVSFKHMSDKFGIPENVLEKDIFILISAFNLNVKVNKIEKTIDFVQPETKIDEVVKDLNILSSEVLTEARAMEVSSIVLRGFGGK
ncbi:hypothetical protein CANARDRAFT_177772 [[Candida] arabinofermentans NRRL YB-2248]|uniref:Uncharacterized protein n=1 Tax=[Candida] arabinofermentans NRRL YB-2248 TaxID=983967 RepID=A0A1E4SUV4_9ASCO|nr:hypothetical protein CANARDRAFT_177772 [[Candida] arabinofermentans NRRL YB-2248]